MKNELFTELNKHILDFEKTYPYVVDHIRCSHTLSNRILEKIHFEEGTFFTLLPETAVLGKLYNFKYGGVLPSLGRKEHPKFANYWPTPNIDKELVEFIFNKLKEKKENSIIFEHILGRPTDPHIVAEGADLCVHRNQIYYVLHSGTAREIISNVSYKSFAFGHYLAVIMDGMGKIGPQLTEENFDAICKCLTHIVVGAYDGEGYIFWEKRQ